MQEGASKKMVIDDFDISTVDYFLNFIYTGNVCSDNVNCIDHLSEEELLSILTMAKKYDVCSLVEIIGEKLAKKISIKNCADLLLVADRYNCFTLKEATVRYAARDIETLTGVRQTEGY